MQRNYPIEYGRFFHIYNRGNNGENVFLQNNDYIHFLNLYSIYIEPVVDTYAWCLLKNHFHFLVRIKEEQEIGYLNSDFAQTKNLHEKWQTFFPTQLEEKYSIKPKPEKQFQHLFNAYSRWFNQKYKRKNALFAKNYHHLLVDNQNYIRNLIVYIHNNPVKHCFVEYPDEYSWSSYLSVVSIKPTKLHKMAVLEYFDNVANFKHLHKPELNNNFKQIKKYIIE